MSNFPTSADSLPTNITPSTPEVGVHASLHNNTSDAVNAIETALLPGGTIATTIGGKAAAVHTHVESDVTSLGTDLAAREQTANKNVANGYAGLDATGNVPASELANASSVPPAANSITTAMLQNVAVTAAKMAAGAATGAVLGGDVLVTGAAAQVKSGTLQAPILLPNGVRLWDGAGVPANGTGANGDLYIRNDGAGTNTLYQRVAGVWTLVGQSGPPTGTAGGALAGTYPNPTLGAGAATGAALGPDVVTTSTTLVGDVGGPIGATTIGPLKVTNPMLATGSVTSSKIGGGAVSNTELVPTLRTTIVQAPPPSGGDDTTALQSALDAASGSTNSTLLQLQNGTYLISATLKISGNTRLEGTMGNPNGTGQGLTTIQPANGAFTGTELICNTQIATTFDLAASANASPWGPGIAMGFFQLLGTRPDTTKPANLSGIRFCGGENSLIDTVGCLGFTAAGFHLVYDSAPMVLRNISSHQNAWGVWLDDAGGPIYIESISGDSNDNLFYIFNTSQDPNLGGGHFLNLRVGQIKAECNAGIGGGTIIHKHNPVIKCVNLAQGMVVVEGSRVSDYSPTTGQATTSTNAILIGTAMTGATTITVASTTGFAVPTAGGPAYFKIDSETFSYTGVGSSTTLTGVTRAVDGTAAAAHSAAATLTQAKPVNKAFIELSASGSIVNEARFASGNISLFGMDIENIPWLLWDHIIGTKFDISDTNAYPEWQHYGIFQYGSRQTFWSPSVNNTLTGGKYATRGFEIAGVNPTISLLDGVDATTATVTQILCGTGAPTMTAPNGSIYIRNDGGAGTTLYQRRAGAWVATAA